MPIHEYQVINAPGCDHCDPGFDQLQRLADAVLTTCPLCGAPVQRALGAPQMAMGHAHTLREKNVAKSGFTQYRRVGKGKYEKTAGKGPATISAD